MYFAAVRRSTARFTSTSSQRRISPLNHDETRARLLKPEREKNRSVFPLPSSFAVAAAAALMVGTPVLMRYRLVPQEAPCAPPRTLPALAPPLCLGAATRSVGHADADAPLDRVLKEAARGRGRHRSRVARNRYVHYIVLSFRIHVIPKFLRRHVGVDR